MMYLFLASILMIFCRGQIDFTQYTCTTTDDCASLTPILQDAVSDALSPDIAKLINTACSSQMGFCSVDCTFDICNYMTEYISGLTCSTDKVCETSLDCSTNGDADCVVTGLRTCGVSGICIPNNTTECTSNVDCTTPGKGYCKDVSLGGQALKICSFEPCCPGTPPACDTANCITADMLCQPASGFCSVGCTADGDCNPLFDIGRTCDTGTGLCSTDAPTRSPTLDPSKSPSTKPSKAPIAETPTQDSQKGGVQRYGLFGVVFYAVMVPVMVWWF